MNRCTICDSTELEDKLEVTPDTPGILFWKTVNEELVCNRCYGVYLDTMAEFNDSELEEGLKDARVLFDDSTAVPTDNNSRERGRGKGKV